ncbi:hypothetical protein ACFLSJ_03095 [Verrucomicrobiota bacterium]
MGFEEDKHDEAEEQRVELGFQSLGRPVDEVRVERQQHNGEEAEEGVRPRYGPDEQKQHQDRHQTAHVTDNERRRDQPHPAEPQRRENHREEEIGVAFYPLSRIVGQAVPGHEVVHVPEGDESVVDELDSESELQPENRRQYQRQEPPGRPRTPAKPGHGRAHRHWPYVSL